MARPAQSDSQMSPNTTTPPAIPMNMELFFVPAHKFCGPTSMLTPRDCDKDYFVATSIVVLRKYCTKDWNFICHRIAEVYGRQLTLNTAPHWFATMLGSLHGKPWWHYDVFNVLKPVGIVLPRPQERGGFEITASAVHDLAFLRFHTTLEWNEIATVMNYHGKLGAGLFGYEIFALFQVLVHENDSWLGEVYERVIRLREQHRSQLEALGRGHDVKIMEKIRNWWNRMAPAAWQPGLAQSPAPGKAFRNAQSPLENPVNLAGDGNNLNCQASLNVAPAAATINAGINLSAGNANFYTFNLNTNHSASDVDINNAAMPMRAMQQPSGQGGNHAHPDYQMLLMRLEQKNKEGSMIPRQKQNSMTLADGQPVMPVQQHLAPPGMSPQASRAPDAALFASLPVSHQIDYMTSSPIPSSAGLSSSKRHLGESDDLEILEVRPRASKRQKSEEPRCTAPFPVHTNGAVNFAALSNLPDQSRQTMTDACSVPISAAQPSSKCALEDSSDPRTTAGTTPPSKRQKPTTAPKAPSKPRKPYKPRKKKEAEPVVAEPRVAEPVRKPPSPDEQAEIERGINEHDERKKHWRNGLHAWKQNSNWRDSADGPIHVEEIQHQKCLELLERQQNGEHLSEEEIKKIEYDQAQQILFKKSWPELESIYESEFKFGRTKELETVINIKVWGYIDEKKERKEERLKAAQEAREEAEKEAQLALERQAKTTAIHALDQINRRPSMLKAPAEPKTPNKKAAKKGSAQPKKVTDLVEKSPATPKKTLTSAEKPTPKRRGRPPKDKNAPAKSTQMVRNSSNSSNPLTGTSSSPVQTSTARTTPQCSSPQTIDTNTGVTHHHDRDGNSVIEILSESAARAARAAQNPEEHERRTREWAEDTDTYAHVDLFDEPTPNPEDMDDAAIDKAFDEHSAMVEQPAENAAGEDWAKQNPEEYETMTQQLIEDLTGADPLLQEVANTIRQKDAQVSDEPLDPGHFPQTAIDKTVLDSGNFLQEMSQQSEQPTRKQMPDDWVAKPNDAPDWRPVWMRNLDSNQDQFGNDCSEEE